jgi:hypothetical protein
MVAILRNHIGNTIGGGTLGRITDISVKFYSKIVIHRLPSANYDTVQTLGTGSRGFSISGIITDALGETWIAQANCKTGSIYFSSSAYGVQYNVQVVFYDPTTRDIGERPFERKFSINAIEVL